MQFKAPVWQSVIQFRRDYLTLARYRNLVTIIADSHQPVKAMGKTESIHLIFHSAVIDATDLPMNRKCICCFPIQEGIQCI